MHKIINQNEPEMITDNVRHPTYRQACKVAPIIKPRTARFKRTAIASGIHYYNKLHTDTASLDPKKCKKLIYMMDNYDEVPKMSQLNRVNKSNDPPIKKPIISKNTKFPGIPTAMLEPLKITLYITNI